MSGERDNPVKTRGRALKLELPFLFQDSTGCCPNNLDPIIAQKNVSYSN